MSDLADFLGKLAASFTRARVQADLEAVRVAELYASHPLLRHFPVPRFRLPTIEVDAPLVIEQVGEGVAEETSVVPLKKKVVRTEALDALKTLLGAREVSLTRTQNTAVTRLIDAELDDLDTAAEVAIDVTETARRISSRLKPVLGDVLAPREIDPEEFSNQLASKLRVRLINARPVPSGIQVAAETAKVRESARSGDVVRLKVTVGEDAMEWTVVESEGEETERLLPE
jgi:hypothetical protein